MNEPSTDDTPATSGFDDLLAANRDYAAHFELAGFDGLARAGVAIVTCMDSRIDPLKLIGLVAGDAKIFRNPGGRVTDAALEALVLATHLLNVDRIVVMPHTRCAMTTSTETQLREQIGASAGKDASWQSFHAITDQQRALREDLARVRSHPLIAKGTLVGGFVYDVDTGLLCPVES